MWRYTLAQLIVQGTSASELVSAKVDGNTGQSGSKINESSTARCEKATFAFALSSAGKK